MIFFIGGMYKAMGPIAFLFFLFYSIFFAAGAMMIYAAWNTIAKTTIMIAGIELVRTQKFAGIVLQKDWTINPRIPAELKRSNISVGSSNNRKAPLSITLRSADGRAINIGSPPFEYERDELIKKINEYLAEQN